MVVQFMGEGGGGGGGGEVGVFVEMERGGSGVLTSGKIQSCAGHLYRLISLSFLPFRVCSKM